MDDTFADESAIFGLPSLDDAPIHSTPIKGGKIPLPSTRNVRPANVQQKTKKLDKASMEALESHSRAQNLKKVSTPAEKTAGEKDVPAVSYTDRSWSSKEKPSQHHAASFSDAKQGRPRASANPNPERSRKTLFASDDVSWSDGGNARNSSSESQRKHGDGKEETAQGKRKLEHFSPGTNTGANMNANAFSRYSLMRQAQNTQPDDQESLNGLIQRRIESRMTSATPERSPFKVMSNTDTLSIAASQTSRSYSIKQVNQTEYDTATVTKQRQEIQLLLAELKDRDRELTDMMNSHQQQLLAWEKDRLRLVSLETRCTQLEDGQRNKSEQLKNTVMHVRTMESEAEKKELEIEEAKQTVENLRERIADHTQTIADLEERNQDLIASVQKLSRTDGERQAREEELNTILKLKDKDISAATGQMRELSDRLFQLDLRCKDVQDREKEAVKQVEQWRRKCEVLSAEHHRMTGEVHTKTTEITDLDKEVGMLRHQLEMVHKDANMREKSKDEVIESMKYKQERTDSQLKNIRELYERQLQELTTLQMQLTTSNDIISRQQTSLQEQQKSNNFSMLSEPSPYKTSSPALSSGRKNSSSRELGSRSSCYRDSVTDTQMSQLHTQSSGYQTQISENQSSTSESQCGAGYQSNTQTVQFPSSDSSIVYQSQSQQRPGDYQASSTSKSRQSDPGALRAQGSIAFSDSASRRFSEGNSQLRKKSSQGLEDSHPGKQSPSSATSSTLPSDDYTSSSSVSDKGKVEKARSGSPRRKDGFVIESTSIKIVKKDKKPDKKAEVKEEMENQYVFENRLESFLQDVEDIDDSIWDNDRTNLSASGIEASPASKLQKLLLESHMMIQNLEKSSDSQLSKESFKEESSVHRTGSEKRHSIKQEKAAQRASISQ